MIPTTSSDDEDKFWLEEGRKRFEAAYAPEEAVYEQLMEEPLTPECRAPESGVEQSTKSISPHPISNNGT